MSRMEQLEQRRRALLARCEAQRDELGWRLTELRAGARPWVAAGDAVGRVVPTRHPLAWVAALGALLLFGRTRDMLTALSWARSALGVVARAAELLQLLRSLRRRG